MISKSKTGTASPTGAPPRKKGSKKKLIIILCVVLVAGGLIAMRMLRQAPTASTTLSYETAVVETRDLSSSFTGSGALEAADSYDVRSLVSGDVLQADFEEGDLVTEEQLLYAIDSSDIENSLAQAEISVDNAARNYQNSLDDLADLRIEAPESGSIISLDIELGDEVKAGEQIALLQNSSTMSLTLPFNTADIGALYIGLDAQVTLDGSYEILPGTITKISDAQEVLTGGMIVQQVTIELQNPGGITPGQGATAIAGGVACNQSGQFEYLSEESVVADVAGTVSALPVAEGAFVSAGQTLAVLTSDQLSDSLASSQNSLTNSQLSLDSQYERLEQYQITSPIGGTIVEKNVKAGETVEAGDTLCTIFDLSYLTLTLQVDELDIGKVEVGQKATITADALDGQSFEGTVTKLSINGSTTNGVTSYPVTIQIDEASADLLPGMNVEAEIFFDTREGALSVPIAAVQRGDQVLLQTDPNADPNTPLPEGSEDTVPEGFELVTVEIGVSDGTYVEILSGLSAGDVVATLQATLPTSDDMSMMMPGMSMGMEAPAGGGGSMAGGGGGGPRGG